MRLVRTGAALLMTWLLGSGIAWAQGPNAQAYELTEEASLIASGAVGSEASVSAMIGFAQAGSPVCPSQYAAPARQPYWNNDIRDKGPVCTLTVTGSNTVDLATGLGTIHGTFKVLLPDPINSNAVDAPELVVIRGTFDGSMDFSPAVLWGSPYGTVAGVLSVDGGANVPFRGVFVMPFDAQCGGWGDRKYRTDCYLTYSLGGNPPVVTVTGMVPVGYAQKAINFPTARFDIYFQP